MDQNTIPLHIAYIGIGGNIGDTVAFFAQVWNSLKTIDEVKHLQASKIYETTPVGGPKQRNYLNAVFRLHTSLTAHELHMALQNIELNLGRHRNGEKNIPRVIDLDVLFFGEEYIETHHLTVPHPRWQNRLFVLHPLANLVKTIAVPQSDQSIRVVNIEDMIESLQPLQQETVTIYQQQEFFL